jgi:phospholipid/cholesterol/gamma-HCH transport system permease protein
MQEEGFHIEGDEGQTVVRLRGSLDTGCVAGIWRQLTGILRQNRLRRLVLDLKDIDRIDSAGVALLQRIDRTCRERGIEYERRHLPAAAQDLLDYISRQSQAGPEPPQGRKHGTVAGVGLRIFGMIDAGRDLAEFTGSFLLAALGGFRRPHRIRIREVLYQMQKNGAEAAPFVIWLSMLMGFIMGIQAVNTLSQFGAEIHIADVVTIGTLKEMAPLLMAVIISGRSGASFTAELGTMKTRQEIDALRVMGIEPMDLLVLPRVFGLALAGPLLTLIADAAGIIGGLIVGWMAFNLSIANFLSEVRQVITAADFVQGAVKGGIFASLIGINGCFHGLRTGTAAEDVGTQTTKAVVTGILLIVISDALLSGIFHVYL